MAGGARAQARRSTGDVFGGPPPDCFLRSCGTGGSRGERKHSITPGDVRTFANPTCGTSARQVDLYSSYACDFILFCFVAAVFVFFLQFTIGEFGMGPAILGS